MDNRRKTQLVHRLLEGEAIEKLLFEADPPEEIVPEEEAKTNDDIADNASADKSDIEKVKEKAKDEEPEEEEEKEVAKQEEPEDEDKDKTVDAEIDSLCAKMKSALLEAVDKANDNILSDASNLVPSTVDIPDAEADKIDALVRAIIVHQLALVDFVELGAKFVEDCKKEYMGEAKGTINRIVNELMKQRTGLDRETDNVADREESKEKKTSDMLNTAE